MIFISFFNLADEIEMGDSVNLSIENLHLVQMETKEGKVKLTLSMKSGFLFCNISVAYHLKNELTEFKIEEIISIVFNIMQSNAPLATVCFTNCMFIIIKKTYLITASCYLYMYAILV